MAKTILEKNFIPIEYFYGGETFLVNGDETDDYYPAICRAQGLTTKTTFPSTLTDEDGVLLPSINGTYLRRYHDDGRIDDDNIANRSQTMIRLVFQPRKYFFSHTIEIVRQVHLLGTGSALGHTGATHFKFPAKIGGIIVHNISSGHVSSKFDAAGVRNDDTIESTFTSPYMVDRSLLGNGMQVYCDWNTDVFLPAPLPIHPYNDAFSINPQGSIIESIFFDGSNGEYYNDKGKLIDIYPEFRLIVGKDEMPLNDRSSNTALNNPYEIAGAWSLLDYQNSEAGINYKSWHTACKGFHGMMLLTVTEVRSCTVANFAGHGVYITGNNHQNNDFCELNRLHIYSNNGDGLHIYGGDAGLVTSINLSSTGNAGWGVVHCGQSATNTFISCQASYNNKGGYLAPDSVYTPTTDVQEPDLRTGQDILEGILLPPALLPMPQVSFSGNGIPDVSGRVDAAGNPVANNGMHGSIALFLGCYSESNWNSPLSKNIAEDNFINYVSILIGCTMGGFIAGHPANLQKLGDGSFTSQGAMTGFGKRTAGIAPNPMSYSRTTIGSSTYRDVALSFTNMFEKDPDPAKNDQFSLETTLIFQYDDENYWAFRSESNMSHSPLSFSTRHNTDIGEAQVWLEKGLFLGYTTDPYSLGDTNKRIRIITSTPGDLQKTISSYGLRESQTKPAKGEYNMYRWEEGDVILNKKPTIGENVGWICCKDPGDSLLKWFSYGTISSVAEAPLEVAEGPLEYELISQNSKSVNDIAGVGSWHYEGGIITQSGTRSGYYSSQKRVTIGGPNLLSAASVTITLFFYSKDNLARDNITLQGAHDSRSGNRCGSVSAASRKFSTIIGKAFNQIGNTLTID